MQLFPEFYLTICLVPLKAFINRGVSGPRGIADLGDSGPESCQKSASEIVRVTCTGRLHGPSAWVCTGVYGCVKNAPV